MPSTFTTHLNLEKPGIGEQENEWGTTLNNNFDTIDTAVNAKIPTSDLLDEDDMASNSATKPASQQSIKAYVDGASVNQEQVEDIVGGMLDGDETFITVTYDDTDGNIDFTVPVKDEDNMASNSATHLATQQSIKAYVDAQVATEDTLSELNDTSISTPAAGHLLIYDNTASHWENATLTAGSNVSITNADGSITIASTDTNTQLSQEQVEDYVGGMLDGTETFIDVSYDDTDGNIDFVVPVLDEDDMASNSATHLATQQSIKAYIDAGGGGGSVAADDITTGDAAVTIATSTGNITVDAQGNDTDIILKGTDGGADTTFLTLDGSDAGTASFNHDVKLASDAAVLGFGADNDVTVTHVADTGLLLNGTSQLQFNDASQNITAPSATILNINATDEVEINATLIDVNGRAIVDNSDDANALAVHQNHASSSQAALYVTKDSGAGYVLNLQNDFPDSYTYLAGPTYGYYHVGGEFFHKNGGQSWICRFRDENDNTNFGVSNIGIFYTGTDTSSPYNRTTSSAGNLRVHTNGTLFRSTSSLRFKTDIEDIDDAWADKLLQLRPICFKSTAPGEVENNPADWTYYGFGAEDVVKIDPRYVFLKTHESEFNEDDVETRTELAEPIAEGVQYDRMVPALVNLVRRLTARVETLEAKVAKLEA